MQCQCTTDKIIPLERLLFRLFTLLRMKCYDTTYCFFSFFIHNAESFYYRIFVRFWSSTIVWLKLPRVNFLLHHQVMPFWAAQLKKQNTHTSRCNFNTVFSASEAEELIKFNCSSLLDAVDLTTSTCQTRTIISLSKIVQTLHSIKEKEIKGHVILVAFAIFLLV